MERVQRRPVIVDATGAPVGDRTYHLGLTIRGFEWPNRVWKLSLQKIKTLSDLREYVMVITVVEPSRHKGDWAQVHAYTTYNPHLRFKPPLDRHPATDEANE